MILHFGRYYAPCKNTGITQKWRIITWLSHVIKVGYGNPAIWLFFFIWSKAKNLKMIGTIYFLIIFSWMQVCTGKQLQQLQRTVEKLQDTILSISKENAKYKILVRGSGQKSDWTRKTNRKIREKMSNKQWWFIRRVYK